MSLTLAQFPEELLERILAYAVIAPASPHPRASWHPNTSSNTPSASRKDTRGRMAPLLVSHAFHRIALPSFYHTLVLHSQRQSLALLTALHARPVLAAAVRVLVLPSPSKTDAEVLGMLGRLAVLDVTLPPNSDSDSVAEDGLAEKVKQLRGLQAVTVRRNAGTYLSQPAPRAMLDAVASAVTECAELHTATLTFPLSSDPALAPLTAALSSAPALHTLRTPLPSLPNAAAAYAAVSSNAALERVCLADDLNVIPDAPLSPVYPSKDKEECAPAPAPAPPAPRRRTSYPASSYGGKRPLLPTALFLSAARPHARLAELICAGTPIAPMASGWRGRAATVGSL